MIWWICIYLVIGFIASLIDMYFADDMEPISTPMLIFAWPLALLVLIVIFTLSKVFPKKG